jgi:hypothetical protein
MNKELISSSVSLTRRSPPSWPTKPLETKAL